MKARMARALMALTAACLGESRRDWSAAMQAGFEAAAAEGDALPFAAGCLAAAWRELLTREEGRFVLTNYALALFDLKRYREAAEAFGRAAEIDPGDYDLQAYRGFALQNAGDETGAREAYQRYLRDAPAGQFAEVVRQILAGRARPPADSGNN